MSVHVVMNPTETRENSSSKIDLHPSGWQCIIFSCLYSSDLLRDFSCFDKMLVCLKLQTCFVLPGLIRHSGTL